MPAMYVTPEAFEALATLTRMRAGSVMREGARRVMVNGESAARVATELQTTGPALRNAVMHARAALRLAELAAGGARDVA